MQKIADSLGVSRITVWKALNDQTGVSDAVRAQVIKLASQLGYTHRSQQKAPALLPSEEKNVSVIVSPRVQRFLDEHYSPDCAVAFQIPHQSAVHLCSLLDRNGLSTARRADQRNDSGRNHHECL